MNDRPSCTCIIGRKGSGKSHLLANLLRDPRGFKKKFHKIIFISPTFATQYDSLWKCLDPEGITVYEEVSDRLLDSILLEQKKNPEPTLLVMDDIADALRTQVDQNTLNLLIANSRHLQLSICVLSQKLTMLPTLLRSQTDTYIMYAACSYIEVEALAREVSTMPKKEFLEFFHTATAAPYAFLCIGVYKGGKVELHPNFE